MVGYTLFFLFPPRPLPGFRPPLPREGALGFLGLIPKVALTEAPLQLRFGLVDSSTGATTSSWMTSLKSSRTSKGTFLGLPRFLGVAGAT